MKIFFRSEFVRALLLECRRHRISFLARPEIRARGKGKRHPGSRSGAYRRTAHLQVKPGCPLDAGQLVIYFRNNSPVPLLTMAKKETSESERLGFPDRVPDLKPGTYKDGQPLHEVQFLECKTILKPERFTSAKSFREYAKLVERAAEENDVDCTDKAAAPRPEIREVLFADTAGFSLYNNAFILRRRIRYEDGFRTQEPEIVLKFRHPEMQRAAEVDVRPQIAGEYVVKFKAEALPLKDEVGGYRLLFSHNVEFGLSQAPEGDRTSMHTLYSKSDATGSRSGRRKKESCTSSKGTRRKRMSDCPVTST